MPDDLGGTESKHGATWFEKPLAWIGFPVIRRLLIRGLGLSAANAEKGLEIVRRGFDTADELLADGRQYLAGERFTIADLTFAASAAPMVLARGYEGNLPGLEELPGPMQDVAREFRSRPAGAFVSRIYDMHR